MNPALAPTDRMKAIYRHYQGMWGEPEHYIWFDPKLATNASLPRFHVAVWPADGECDVTTFITLGVSDVPMGPSCSHQRIEFHWAIRSVLDHDQTHQCARYLANLSEYPFQNNRCLDFWHRLTSPKKIPLFPHATALLLRPPFTADACSMIEFDNQPIRMLHIVPLLPAENEILATHGVEAYEEYLDRHEIDPLGVPESAGLKPS